MHTDLYYNASALYFVITNQERNIQKIQTIYLISIPVYKFLVSI